MPSSTLLFVSPFRISSSFQKPLISSVSEFRSGVPFRFRSLARRNSASLSSNSVGTNGTFVVREERIGPGINGANGELGSKVEEEKKGNDVGLERLEPLWEDGYGTETVKDYLDFARDMIKPDGGPPRWFSPVACGCPIKNSPLLLFLPGLDGVGLGLILHHKPLGKVFEVRCMHIPVHDRTRFEGLVEIVESAVRLEHSLSPNKPIYLVGDSFGGCLALAVAARNPTIDLILILANPATSFGKSHLQPFLPILEAWPDELHFTIPYLLSFIMGDPLRMAMVSVENGLPPSQTIEQLSGNLTSLLPRLSSLADIVPKQTLLWKLKLLKSASAYANSRLHAVKSEVLILASGKDNMLPSRDEAQRLSTSLQNCRVRYFKDNGHTLLLEDGINLLKVIKGTHMYRRSRRHDCVSDFLPPTMTEFKEATNNGLLRFATSPVMLSTLEDGKIVRGLAGLPNEGPVLLVGYHMLAGFELAGLIEEFLRERKVMIRGLAHPILFSQSSESSLQEFSLCDSIRLFGALPVTASNFFKLLSTKSYVLLYPGGAREALHHKGEEYKLFWPNEPEFVRMAARFGATIIPFGVVGEDDIAELVLDYNDIMSIPFVGELIKKSNKNAIKIRANSTGEVANEDLVFPGLLPKIPGRFYYLFGKPVELKGKEGMAKDKESANVLYLQIKSEIERLMAYLLKKRKEDPYRGILQRTIYRAIFSPTNQVPTFKP